VGEDVRSTLPCYLSANRGTSQKYSLQANSISFVKGYEKGIVVPRIVRSPPHTDSTHSIRRPISPTRTVRIHDINRCVLGSGDSRSLNWWPQCWSRYGPRCGLERQVRSRRQGRLRDEPRRWLRWCVGGPGTTRTWESDTGRCRSGCGGCSAPICGALWKVRSVPQLRFGLRPEFFVLGSRKPFDVRLGLIPAQAPFSDSSKTLHAALQSLDQTQRDHGPDATNRLMGRTRS